MSILKNIILGFAYWFVVTSFFKLYPLDAAQFAVFLVLGGYSSFTTLVCCIANNCRDNLF